MASAAFHGLFDIQQSSASSSTVASPPPTHQKSSSVVKKTPVDFELDDLAFGQRYNVPSSSHTAPRTPKDFSRAQTPKTPNEFENDGGEGSGAVPLMQTWREPSMNKWRILCCCLTYFGMGLNDSGRLSPCIHIDGRCRRFTNQLDLCMKDVCKANLSQWLGPLFHTLRITITLDMPSCLWCSSGTQ